MYNPPSEGFLLLGKSMHNIFFTADLHFFHKNILNFCPTTRGNCESLDEMHQRLIANWNSQVSFNDHVYCLGDFSFGNSAKTFGILSQLKGQIHLIKGNHDNWVNSYCKTLLTSVSDYKELKVSNKLICMFHYPILEWRNAHYGSYHLFGHVHGKDMQISGRALDVGIDARPNGDMKLWTLQEVIDYMEPRLKTNHHKE